MGSNIDFVELYRELGLPPDCNQEALTLAYRRLVAELHPDRHGEGAGTARLRRLNQLYQAAMEFHRIHGHLPGARPASPPPPPVSAVPCEAAPAPVQREGRAVRTVSWLVVLSAAAMLLPGWLETTPAQQPPAPAPAAAGTPGAAASSETGMQWVPDEGIRAGSTAAQVLANEGPPLSGDDVHWEYGPSWVRFHCGRVIAWHSSALRPLHIARDTDAGTWGKGAGESGECKDTGEE